MGPIYDAGRNIDSSINSDSDGGQRRDVLVLVHRDARHYCNDAGRNKSEIIRIN